MKSANPVAAFSGSYRLTRSIEELIGVAGFVFDVLTATT
jgi:hypothetical protein